MATRQRGPGGRFVAATTAAATAPEMPATAEPGARSVDLYLVRHADAGDSSAWTGDDAVRPLSKKGRRQSRRLGDLLADVGVRPAGIATSPRVRAADTAKLVGKRIGCKPVVDERLDWGFDTARLDEILSEQPAGGTALMLVGHDPAFSDIASWLVGAPLALAKGALARIDLPDGRATEGGGVLRWLLPPDAVPR